MSEIQRTERRTTDARVARARNWRAPDQRSRFQTALLLILGIVIGELISMWAFSSPIDQTLADRTSTRPAVTAAQIRLDAARADRARLDADVNSAQDALDEAVVRANCEVNPKPGCPTDGQVTGVAGAGSETDAARGARDTAMTNLDAAIDARTQQSGAIDSRIEKAQDALLAAEAAAPSASFGTRWIALNTYSFGHLGALALRLLLIGLFAVICVAPLLFVRWRGETAAKRLARAEADAEAEVAIRKAELRAEAEKLQAEQELEKARIAAEAELFLEQEKQRRRVAAELGDTPKLAFKPEDEGRAALPASESSSWVPAPFQGIANIASSVISAPARVAQTVVEEFEELTFTITRKRKVTVTPAEESRPQLTSDSALVIDAEVVDELPSAPRRELPRGV